MVVPDLILSMFLHHFPFCFFYSSSCLFLHFLRIKTPVLQLQKNSKENKMDAACSIQTDIHGLMLIFICVKHSGYTHIFMRNFLQNSLAVFYLVQHLRIKCLVFEHCDLICVRSKRILLVFSDVRRFHNFGNVFQLRMMRNII